MDKPIRAFIASELPREVIDFAAELQNRLKGRGFALKWVRPQNMHLTLKFLGDIEYSLKDGIIEAMAKVAQTVSPMTLGVQGMGVFPGIRKARVLWIGLGGDTDRLTQAHALLQDALVPMGFSKEKRHFNAHLTLARINTPLDAGRLLEVIQMEGGYPPMTFCMDEIILFQSELRPQGSRYTALGRVALSGIS